MVHEYKQTIEQFVAAYYQRRKWEIEQAFISLTGALPIIPAEPLLESALADQLSEIARAAAGELQRTDWNMGVLQEGIQDLMERLFAPPGLTTAYDVPERFWETDLGAMVARALIWLRGDELVSLSEASEILNVSLPAVSQAVDAGRLRAYYDPDSAGPNRGRRKVSRADVEQLKQSREAE